VLTQPAEDQKPPIITQNSEAKAVLMGPASIEGTQETLALLKVFALGQKPDSTPPLLAVFVTRPQDSASSSNPGTYSP
jgi:hypothetical protein